MDCDGDIIHDLPTFKTFGNLTNGRNKDMIVIMLKI